MSVTFTKSGKTLYALALERPLRSGEVQTKMLYMHAPSAGELRARLLRSRSLIPRGARVVWIAPAVGGFVQNADKPEEGEMTVE